jgi:hypothetical protein
MSLSCTGISCTDLSGKQTTRKQLMSGSGIEMKNQSQKLLPKRLATYPAITGSNKGNNKRGSAKTNSIFYV